MRRTNRPLSIVPVALALVAFISLPAVSGCAAEAMPNAPRPTVESLLALEMQANAAYFKGDTSFFEATLSDKFVMLGPGGQRMDKAAAIGMIRNIRCDIREGWHLDEPTVSTIDADTYVLTYKGTFSGSCIENGKSESVPSPVRAATVWIRSGERWLAAFHGENRIVDPKAPEKHADTSQASPNQAKKGVPSEPELSPRAVTEDPATAAVVAVERIVWEAWKVHDRQTIEDRTAEELSFVDIFGNVRSTRADTLKLWTDSPCDIKSVSVNDGTGTPISGNVTILTFKGRAEGTCYGEELPATDIYGTSVYVKKGDAWKLAFTLNHSDNR